MVVLGRVVSGTLKVGDSVVLQPSNITTEVASIEMYHTARQVALPGDLVAFKYNPSLSRHPSFLAPLLSPFPPLSLLSPSVRGNNYPLLTPAQAEECLSS